MDDAPSWIRCLCCAGAGRGERLSRDAAGRPCRCQERIGLQRQQPLSDWDSPLRGSGAEWDGRCGTAVFVLLGGSDTAAVGGANNAAQACSGLHGMHWGSHGAGSRRVVMFAGHRKKARAVANGDGHVCVTITMSPCPPTSLMCFCRWQQSRPCLQCGLQGLQCGLQGLAGDEDCPQFGACESHLAASDLAGVAQQLACSSQAPGNTYYVQRQQPVRPICFLVCSIAGRSLTQQTGCLV